MPDPTTLPDPVSPPVRDPLLDQLRDSQTLALSESLRQANAQNPDRAASIVKLAAQTRLHPSTVAEVEGDARATVAVQQADVGTLLRDHPELSAWLLNQQNAAVSHDDLPGLKALDQMVRQLNVGPRDDPLGILPKGYQFSGRGDIVRPNADGTQQQRVGDYQGLQADLEAKDNTAGMDQMVAAERDRAVGQMADPFVAGFMGSVGGTLRAAHALAGTDSTDLIQSSTDIAQSSAEQHPGFGNDALRMAGGLAADLPLLFAGGPVARAAKGLGEVTGTLRLLSPILGKEAATALGERALTAAAMSPLALKSGIVSGQEHGGLYGATDALINMAIPAAFGRVGVQRLLTPALGEVGVNAAIPAATFLLKQAGLDAGQNQAIELATALHEYATGADPQALNPSNLVSRLALAGLAGATMGGLFNLPEASRIKLARQGLAIRQAHAEADALSAATDAAIASKATQRAPDQVAEMVKQVVDSTGGSGGTVYAQGEAFRDHYQAQGEDPAKAAEAMGVDPAAYAAAMASGSPLPIPLHGFLTRAREEDKPLLDHLTLRPDALTRTEAGIATETLRSEIDQQVAAAGKQSETTDTAAKATASLDESSNRVGDLVEQQLVTAGAKPDTAKYQSLVWAKSMRQLAERWNEGAAARGAKPLTPEDIFNRYRVQITGPDAAHPEDIARQFSQDQAVAIAPRGTSLEFGDLRRQWQKAHGERAVDTTSKEWNDLVQASARVDAKSGKVYFQPAYHGSGTSEPFDKLDYSKVNGKGGEGTQNEGWGLYVTKAKQAAAFYREQNRNLLGGGPTMQEMLKVYFKPGRVIDGYGGKSRVVDFHESADGLWSVTTVPDRNWSDYDRARTDGERRRLTTTHSTPPSQKALDAVIAKEAPEIVAREKANSGRLYEVDIPDNTGDNYLDWDTSISKQSKELRARLRQAGVEDFHQVADGEAIYDSIVRRLGSKKAASDALHAAGVVGIKYRGDEESGHSNYVIFQDVPIRSYEQPGDNGQRGQINIGKDKSLNIQILANADRSTFLHETGHAYLEILTDLAAHPDAAPSIKGDLGTIREWLKAEEGKPWTVDQHEQFARGFERYLMEGKAPSRGLRTAFRTFARWLTKLYSDLRNLRVELTPEVRRVFDKMLASDEEIAAAGESMHADPFFQRAEDAGMTPAEFAAYQRAAVDAKVLAADALRADLLSFEKTSAIADRARAEGAIRAHVTDEVNLRPDMQAIAALQDGELPPGLTLPAGTKVKLDRAELVDRYGKDALRDLPGPKDGDENAPNAGRRLYAADGGMSLDDAAVLFGFKDGDSLWSALTKAPDRMHAIDVGVADEMAKAFPDPIDSPTLESDAAAHLADETAGEVVAREVDALERMAKAEPTPRELIRQAAERTVAGMRAYTLKPEAYRAAAEKAAVRQFAKQVKLRDAKPDQREALAAEVLAIAKERLTNLELFAAARRAKNQSEASERWIKSHDTLDARERLGKAGGWEFTAFDAYGSPVGTFPSESEALSFTRTHPGHTFDRTSGYLEQWDAIQEGFKLKRASLKSLRRRESLRQWIDRQEADGEPVAIPDRVVEDLGKRHWNEITIAQQREVSDALRNVYQLATFKNKLMAAKRKRDLEAVADEVAASIVKHAEGTVAARLGTTGREKVAEGVGAFLASHRKDSFVARAMDGYQDGGAIWEHFIVPRNEAAAHKSKMMADAGAQRHEVLAAWDKKAGTAREDIPGTHLRLTREQRIGMALYWGNREGRQRVLADLERQDVPAGESDVHAVLDSLDANDWQLVKATWKQINGYWHEIASLERRTSGLVPERVKAVPFRTKFGTVEGGYYPIKYDHTQGSKATNIDDATDAKSKLRAANVASTTRRGFTKQRADQVQGRGLRYDFGTVSEHLNEVVHDLTHRELLQDQNRLFRNELIASTIVRHYGKRTLDQLVNTTADIAQGEAPAKSAAERFSRTLRKGVSAAAFGYNATSAIANATGLLQAVPRVGVARTLQALSHVTGNAVRMQGALAEAEGRSEFMASRARTFMREVAEANATTGTKGTLDTIQRIGYWPMTQVQRVVDAITWHAGYDLGLSTAKGKGLEGKAAEEMALQIADQTVIDTQGSGRVGDLPAIMRGGEVAKFFTSFYSYFSTTYNLMNESLGRAVRKGEVAQMAGNALVLWALPAVLTDLIGSALRGDPSYSWKKLAESEISYGLGMMVGFRELSGVIQGHAYSGPGSLGLINHAGQLIQQANQGAVDAGLLKAAAGGVLAPFGLPAVEVGRLIDAWTIAAERGDYVAALRAAAFGKPRRE